MPLVVMGVSGSGKSTVAAAVAGALDGIYLDADDFHPPANVTKMVAGIPLTDEDRMPWLRVVGEAIVAQAARGRLPVVACSALRRRYRDALRATAGELFFVQLDGSPELLSARIGARPDHFMPPALLRSQLETLEPLEPDEQGVVVSVDQSVEHIVAAVRKHWAARTGV
ncbi:gluconokinase [Microbacterium flavescens]|jgi:carbohydrate kinase (thermoresistant glucokinase family)|uniref:gluconokinase n=1 Tax=Microbacterium flavescens TaxID=69366 RepID=UPI001BDF2E9E|nr:gluconokinase [Microbacterium flavescens]BFF10119.1 gluconokinase [Microbacterium flavescens]